MIAALYIDPRGCYPSMPGVDTWDESRDADNYAGPWPVVAHPPCGPWSALRHLSRKESLVMGDRGNIYVRHGKEPGVYLYSHWGGHDMPSELREVLKRGDRLDDAQYLTRIIFCALVGNRDWDKTDGYGISATPGDNEHALLVVDTEAQRVFVTEFPHGSAPDGDGLSFADYCKLSDAALERFSENA